MFSTNIVECKKCSKRYYISDIVLDNGAWCPNCSGLLARDNSLTYVSTIDDDGLIRMGEVE